MNYMTLFNLEIRLSNYLNDILEYAESACIYLEDQYNELDKEEIIMNLSDIPDYIKGIKEIIQKIEEIYEQERIESKNE